MNKVTMVFCASSIHYTSLLWDVFLCDKMYKTCSGIVWQLLLFGVFFYYKNYTLYQIINMQINRLVQYIGL